jgi:hypothetical protein
VREMVARFQERAEWCSHLKTSSSRVCDLVLGLADDRVHLVACLEESTGQLQVMMSIKPLIIHPPGVLDLVLERSSVAPAWLALTAILSDFPGLELELELLGFGYKADMMKDEMEVLWTQTHQASKPLSSRVPPSIAHSSTDGTGE